MKRRNELHCRVLATNVIEFSRTARQGRGRGRRPWAQQTAADRAPWSRYGLGAVFLRTDAAQGSRRSHRPRTSHGTPVVVATSSGY